MYVVPATPRNDTTPFHYMQIFITCLEHDIRLAKASGPTTVTMAASSRNLGMVEPSVVHAAGIQKGHNKLAYFGYLENLEGA